MHGNSNIKDVKLITAQWQCSFMRIGLPFLKKT